MPNQATPCLFCQIAAKKIPAEIIYEDEDLLAFKDISARAPHHLLIIPKQHIMTLNDLDDSQTELAGKLLQTAKNLAKQLYLTEVGYRTVINCGKDAGQTVFHLHVHLLGGRVFQWPPG